MQYEGVSPSSQRSFLLGSIAAWEPIHRYHDFTYFPHFTHLLSASYLDCCDEVDGSFFTLTVSTCPGSFFSFGSDVDPAAPPPRLAVNCALSLRLCNLQVISSRHKSTFYANYLLRPFRHSSGIIAQALMIYFQPDKSNRKKREFACNLAQLYPRTTGLIYV